MLIFFFFCAELFSIDYDTRVSVLCSGVAIGTLKACVEHYTDYDKAYRRYAIIALEEWTKRSSNVSRMPKVKQQSGRSYTLALIVLKYHWMKSIAAILQISHSQVEFAIDWRIA